MEIDYSIKYELTHKKIVMIIFRKVKKFILIFIIYISLFLNKYLSIYIFLFPHLLDCLFFPPKLFNIPIFPNFLGGGEDHVTGAHASSCQPPNHGVDPPPRPQCLPPPLVLPPFYICSLFTNPTGL